MKTSFRILNDFWFVLRLVEFLDCFLLVLDWILSPLTEISSWFWDSSAACHSDQSTEVLVTFPRFNKLSWLVLVFPKIQAGYSFYLTYTIPRFCYLVDTLISDLSWGHCWYAVFNILLECGGSPALSSSSLAFVNTVCYINRFSNWCL